MKRSDSIAIVPPEAALRLRRRVLLLPLVLAGCAEPLVIGPGTGDTRPPPPGPQRIATLDVEGEVEVRQGGRRFRGQDGTALFRGDEVRTFPTSYALLTFLDGDRVWLDYDTHVRLGSIFAFFGRVFASVSGVFQVDSQFVAASTEGTEFTVAIGRAGSGSFSVAVRSGVVRCDPRRGRWRPLRLTAGQRLRGQADAQPTIDRLDARESQVEFGWVGARRVPPQRVQPVPRRPVPQAPQSPPPQSPPPVLR